MTQPFRLLLIGDSDSQLLACEALCRFPEHLHVEVTINAIPREGTPEPILRRAEGLGTLWRFQMGQLVSNPLGDDRHELGTQNDPDRRLRHSHQRGNNLLVWLRQHAPSEEHSDPGRVVGQT